MSRALGVASYQEGRGRVVAFTKAFSIQDFTFSGQNQDLFTRLFLNAVNYACLRHQSTRVWIHDTDNEALNDRLIELITDLQLAPALTLPWYEEQTINQVRGINACGLRIIMPSYNASIGLTMPDVVQRDIMYRTREFGEGLLLGEWFHLLQSMPTRRSFSYHGDGTVPTQTQDETKGLYTISPFLLNLDKQVVFTAVDELEYIKVQDDDSLAYTLPPRFSITNINRDVNFQGHLSQLADLREGAESFWITDVPAISNVTTTTTTTTTTEEPETADIKMKLFNVDMINYCGPQDWYLDGLDKDKFSFDGKSIFMTKKPVKEDDWFIDLVAEDHFDPKRMNKKIEPIKVVIRDCQSCLTLPKNLAGPAWSYRGWPSEEQHQAYWGSDAPTGIIQNFDEWQMSGIGDIDDPLFVSLGGRHSDMNAIWFQINFGGTISGRLIPSLSNTFPYLSSTQNTPILDFGTLFYITNTIDPDDDIPEVHPAQHTEDLITKWRGYPNVSVIGSQWFDYGVTGKTESIFSFNVDDPEALDGEGNRIRGNSYLVLYLRKNSYYTEKKIFDDVRDDKIYLSAFCGTTTTTPSPDFDYNILIINNVPNTTISRETLLFTSPAKLTPVLPSKTFVITADNPYGITSLSATDNAEEVTVSVGSSITTPIKNRTITVNLNSMPVNGGSATVILSGTVTTTSTTPPPPTECVTVNIFNNVQNASVNSAGYLETFTYEICAAVGTTAGSSSLSRFVQADTGYEWRDSNKPTFTLTSANPTSAYYDSSISRSGSSNTICYYSVTALIPEGGGTINMTMSAPDPVPTTTTSTTTTPEPCNDLIQIICEQTLICSEDADGNCQAALPVSQTVKYATCCDIDEATVMARIRDAKGAGATDTLAQIYASDCPATTNTLLNPCQPKDQDGDCQETIHAVIIDEVSCPATQNPLP